MSLDLATCSKPLGRYDVLLQKISGRIDRLVAGAVQFGSVEVEVSGGAVKRIDWKHQHMPSDGLGVIAFRLFAAGRRDGSPSKPDPEEHDSQYNSQYNFTQESRA